MVIKNFDTNKSRRNVARRDLYNEDRSANYPEMRIKTIGLFEGQLVLLVWTPVGEDETPHAISIRLATPTETQQYVDFLEGR